MCTNISVLLANTDKTVVYCTVTEYGCINLYSTTEAILNI